MHELAASMSKGHMKSPSDMSANALRYTPATEHSASLHKRILAPAHRQRRHGTLMMMM